MRKLRLRAGDWQSWDLAQKSLAVEPTLSFSIFLDPPTTSQKQTLLSHCADRSTEAQAFGTLPKATWPAQDSLSSFWPLGHLCSPNPVGEVDLNRQYWWLYTYSQDNVLQAKDRAQSAHGRRPGLSRDRDRGGCGRRDQGGQHREVYPDFELSLKNNWR